MQAISVSFIESYMIMKPNHAIYVSSAKHLFYMSQCMDTCNIYAGAASGMQHQSEETNSKKLQSRIQLSQNKK